MINKKQKEFIRQYFLCGRNGTEAYQKAYACAKRSTARNNSSELLAKPDIKEAIEREEDRLAEKYNITQEKMIDDIKELIYACQTGGDYGPDRSTWARGLDMLAKLTGQYSPDKIEVIGNINIKLNELDNG